MDDQYTFYLVAGSGFWIIAGLILLYLYQERIHFWWGRHIHASERSGNVITAVVRAILYLVILGAPSYAIMRAFAGILADAIQP